MNYPFMGLMPFQYPTREANPDLPPARVRAAMEFVNSLTYKTMARVALNDLQIQEIPGQKLTDEELTAQATAFNLLSSYFSGRLKPDDWEKLDLEVPNKSDQAGSVINCPICIGSSSRADCILCKGRGQVVVYPTTS